MSYKNLLAQITPEIYANMRRAIGIGRWPDGRKLTDQQRQDCMQAVIAYEQINVSERERTGYIDRGHKEGGQCDDVVQTLNFKE